VVKIKIIINNNIQYDLAHSDRQVMQLHVKVLLALRPPTKCGHRSGMGVEGLGDALSRTGLPFADRRFLFHLERSNMQEGVTILVNGCPFLSVLFFV
jgi:hypothetical protein